MTRTVAIAERCNVKLNKIRNPFPKFDIPDGHTIDSYFEGSVAQGFARRLDAAA